MDDHDHSASMADMSMGDMGTMGHGTAFTTAYRATTVLFAGWSTMNEWQYALTLIALICFGILSESMCVLERGLHALIDSPEGPKGDAGVPTVTLGFRMARSVLYTARTTLHFLLMLASMTFDVGIFISIMAGFGIGYFVFSSKNLNAHSTAGHYHA